MNRYTAIFAPLAIPNLRIYLGGQTISLIGTWLQVTAQGWVVWQLTGSPGELSLATMLSTLPIFILGPWAGVWADRFDRRKLLIITQLGAMLLAFTLSGLVFTNLIQVWHIYVLSFLLGIITAIDMPAQQAFLGDLAGREIIRQAVNLNITILQISRILGPAIAGIVVGAVGAGAAFFFNGVSFLAVVISLTLVRTLQARTQHHSGDSVLKGFNEALQFINNQPRLRDCILFAVMVTFFGLSIIMNILPAVASAVLGGNATTLGQLMTASGVGSLIGTVIVAPMVQARKRVGIALSSSILFGAGAFLLLGMTSSLPIALLALFIGGFAFPPVMTTVMGILQVSAPPAMRARVMSLFTMVSFGLQPIASLWIGWSAEHLGIQNSIMLNAVLLMTGAVLMVIRLPLRQWEGIQPADMPEAAPSHG